MISKLSTFLLASAFSCLALHADDNLWNRFVNPTVETGTKLWWFHGETETTEEGIDADLEQFKEKGVGGVVFYDQVHGKGEGAFPSMSPQWWKMLKHAALKAKDLGLSFEVAVGNGYVTGGPWITPELGMKQTEFLDTVINVDKRGKIQIALDGVSNGFKDVATVLFPAQEIHRSIPVHKGTVTLTENDTIVSIKFPEETNVAGISYTLTPRGKGSTGSMNIPGKPQERYFGAYYVDYPPVGQLEYSSDGKTWNVAADLLPIENNIGNKSRRRSISFPAVKGSYFRLNLHDWKGNDDRYKTIKLDNTILYSHDIVDNQEMKTGLRTEVTYNHPAGGNNGAVDSSAVINVTDSLSPDGTLSLTIDPGKWHVIRFGYRPTGSKTKHGRKNLLGLEADVMSAEAASIHFDNYFKPVCDTLSAIGAKPKGMCMDSHEAGVQNWTKGFESKISENIGSDFTKWIPAFAGYIVDDREATDRFLLDFRKLIARTIASEYYGTFARRCNELGVDYTSQAMLNIDNDNIASRGKATKPQGEFWAYQKNGNYDCLDAASAAHLYGHPIASGEAFTDSPYDTSWDELLRIANIAYCRGINEFAVCASSYQPWLDRKYDDSASSHPYIFHRMNPEWNSIGDFWRYQARCADMLRQGIPVVDRVYIGEDVPLKTFAYKLPVIPEGYNFDVLNNDALINRLSADNGEISVKGGMRYKALIVQDRTYISDEAEKKIDELKSKGVTVIRCDKGENVAVRLEEAGLIPDISIKSADLPDDKTLFFHRSLPGGDIYFIYNHSPHEISQPLTLRTPFSKAAIWNPKTVKKTRVKPVSPNTLPVTLSSYQSLFIITRK